MDMEYKTLVDQANDLEMDEKKFRQEMEKLDALVAKRKAKANEILETIGSYDSAVAAQLDMELSDISKFEYAKDSAVWEAEQEFAAQRSAINEKIEELEKGENEESYDEGR